MAWQHDPDSLKAVTLLPAAFRPVFSFRYFNSVQSECFASAFLSNDNMVISAPTGSGKTVLFELCILQLLKQRIGADGQFHHTPGTLKTVYVAPTRALVQEKLREWSQRFGQTLGLNCQELTGDSIDVRPMQDTDIILTTPEKFDSITRKNKDHGGLSFFADVALFEIDEVHLLHEPRGAALEAIVSRMKMLARYPEMRGCPLSNIRFVAVSATIPNIEDIGEWLKVPPHALKKFGEEVRPVRLSTKVLGYAPAKNDFLFERRLQSFLFDIIMQDAKGRAVLVFCSTRKGAQEAAVTVARAASNLNFHNPFITSQEHHERLQLAARSSKDKHLQECIRCGVGFHNGGMDTVDRNLVENLFLRGDLQVLCTTNTLAHGVNLPAHTVIIKSTQYFNKDKGCYMEYERSTLVQMCGRAGRPQFDESGQVIIMTRRDTVHLYENLLSGSEVVESELLPAIAEHLNAEIVLLTVSDVSLAIEWLKASFLYIRIRKNPQHYKIENKAAAREDHLENQLKGICLRNVSELAEFQLAETDEYGFLLKPLDPGKLMAKYYLNFNTMKEITKAPVKCTIEHMLYVLAKSQELSWIQLRRSEKKFLNDINSSATGKVKYHVLAANGKIKKRIQSREEKIFVLANDALSGDPSTLDFTMSQDVTAICTNGARITRCMSEYFKFMKRYQETVTALKLANSIHQRLWEDSPYQLKQLAGVGMVTAKAFLQVGIDSFEKLAAADPRKLETVTGRKYPFGNQVKEALDKLPPKIEITLTVNTMSGKNDLILTLARPSGLLAASNNWNVAHLVVGTETSNQLHYYEKIRVEQFSSPYTVSISLESIGRDKNVDVAAALIFENYVGIDVEEKLVFSPTRNFMKVSKSRIQQENGRLPRSLEPLNADAAVPSFELISETLKDEDNPATKTPNKETETLFTGDKIFDHINEKAKCLPGISRRSSPTKPQKQQPIFKRKPDSDSPDDRRCIPAFSASKLPRISFNTSYVQLRDEQNSSVLLMEMEERDGFKVEPCFQVASDPKESGAQSVYEEPVVFSPRSCAQRVHEVSERQPDLSPRNASDSSSFIHCTGRSPNSQAFIKPVEQSISQVLPSLDSLLFSDRPFHEPNRFVERLSGTSISRPSSDGPEGFQTFPITDSKATLSTQSTTAATWPSAAGCITLDSPDTVLSPRRPVSDVPLASGPSSSMEAPDSSRPGSSFGSSLLSSQDWSSQNQPSCAMEASRLQELLAGGGFSAFSSQSTSIFSFL